MAAVSTRSYLDMPGLDRVKTIVIVMMENRSFDHMLGYLGLPPYDYKDIDGQKPDAAWLDRFTNSDAIAGPVQPFAHNDPYKLPPNFDPPHQRSDVAKHLGTTEGGSFLMNGFVSALPTTVSSSPIDRRLVMGYFGADEAPINHFFASHFTICDRWFCSLPAGTQANRLMAMSGMSLIDVNRFPLPPQELVYDWLTAHNVNWCVYHQGIPFFSMMFKWIPEILLSKRFRPFHNFQADMANTPPGQRPEVIFIEPVYGDAPHLGRCTDDHAPSGISDGQEFLMQVYNAVRASLSFWRDCLLIISYDEHGGFFDHVSPPLIPTEPPAAVDYPRFESLGIRVPGFIVSPYVKRSVAHNLFDHTSVLKVLGEKFGNGSYSPAVDARPVESISAALDDSDPILNPPGAPPVDVYLSQRPPAPTMATVPEPDSSLKKAFRMAINEMKKQGADENHPKFGPLLQQVPNTEIT